MIIKVSFVYDLIIDRSNNIDWQLIIDRELFVFGYYVSELLTLIVNLKLEQYPNLYVLHFSLMLTIYEDML